jgi:hypothetical protein
LFARFATLTFGFASLTNNFVSDGCKRNCSSSSSIYFTFNLKIKGRFPKGYSGSVILNSGKEILGIMVRSNFEEVDKEKYGVILRIEAIEFLISGQLK